MERTKFVTPIPGAAFKLLGPAHPIANVIHRSKYAKADNVCQVATNPVVFNVPVVRFVTPTLVAA